MSNQRGRLQVRRAGLATAVVLGCGLVAAAQVPSVAQAFGALHPAASDRPLNVPDFLSLRFATPAQNPAAAQAAQAAQAGSASGVSISGKPGTAPGLPKGLPGTSPTTTTPGTPAPGGTANVTGVLAQAYQQAAAGAPAGCHIPATLLEAIGQVESSNLAGQSITADHRAYPGVYGPVLNGSSGYAAIPDTDKGVLDGDKVWDRAVGPMQFIPGTWRVFGTDGDHDGKADPQNVFDAAATAAKYLCYGGRDLSTAAGIDAAVLSYNHSDAYLQTVLAWKKSFDTGKPVQQVPTVPNMPNKVPAPTPTTPGTTTPTTPTTPPRTTPGRTTPNAVTAAAFRDTVGSAGAVSFDASASRPAPDASMVSYRWDFGDHTAPVTSSTPTRTHTYAASGTYQVRLVVTDSAGHTSSVTHPVTVTVAAPTPAPVADFTVAATATGNGYDLALTGSPTMQKQQHVTDTWTLDSQPLTSTKATAHAEKVAAGKHTVTLTVTNAAGAKAVKTVELVLGKPFAKVTVTEGANSIDATDGKFEVTSGAKVIFDASKVTGPTTDAQAFAWTFSDSGPTVSAPKTTHTFTKDGTATLTVTDKAGNTETFTFTVNVTPASTPAPSNPSSGNSAPGTSTDKPKTPKKTNGQQTPAAQSSPTSSSSPTAGGSASTPATGHTGH